MAAAEEMQMLLAFAAAVEAAVAVVDAVADGEGEHGY